MAGYARSEITATRYFHVVFTLPHELAPLCQRNQRVLYNLLFRTSAETMLKIAADPKHLGAEIGFLSILHTWGQNLMLHPHVRQTEEESRYRRFLSATRY